MIKIESEELLKQKQNGCKEFPVIEVQVITYFSCI